MAASASWRNQHEKKAAASAGMAAAEKHQHVVNKQQKQQI